MDDEAERLLDRNEVLQALQLRARRAVAYERSAVRAARDRILSSAASNRAGAAEHTRLEIGHADVDVLRNDATAPAVVGAVGASRAADAGAGVGGGGRGGGGRRGATGSRQVQLLDLLVIEQRQRADDRAAFGAVVNGQRAAVREGLASDDRA